METAALKDREREKTGPEAAVERALDVSLIVIRNGGSTTMAERTFGNVLAAHGVSDISTAWRLDLVTAGGGAEGQSWTVMKPVGPIGINLVRASQAAALAERAARGEISGAALEAEVARLKDLAPPYNRWVMTAAAAFTAAVSSQLLGRDWGALGITFVAGGIGQFCRSLLQARKLEVAPVTLIAALISACLAALGLRAGLSQAAPATLIASVFYMIPGLPLINGFIDAVSHRHLFVGLERMANAAFLFMILAVAVTFAYAFVM